jgi:hypothetical protein
MVARRRRSSAVGLMVVVAGALAPAACHRRGSAVGGAGERDGGAGADAGAPAPVDCGPRTTVAVSGRVVVGGDACRGVASETTVSFRESTGRVGAVAARVPCGGRFTVQLSPGRYNIEYRLYTDQFHLDLSSGSAEVGSVPVELGDLVFPAHRVTGRVTVNGQAPRPIPGVTSPCAHIGFRTPDGLNRALSYVDCQTAGFTAVVPDQTVEVYYAGLEVAYPAEVTGPALPFASRMIDPAARIDADREDWALDLRLVRVSGQIAPQPAMPGLAWAPCTRSPGQDVAQLWLQVLPQPGDDAVLPVCDGKFDGYVWPGAYLASLSFAGGGGSWSQFLLQTQVDLSSDVHDLRLPVQPVTWRGRLVAHGRPVELPAGPLAGLLSFTGGAIDPSWITVQGGAPASFTAVLPRAQFMVGAEEVGGKSFLPSSLTDEIIDLVGAPAQLDRDLELDLYRTAGRVTASGGVLDGCARIDELWLREDIPGRSPLALAPLGFSCGPGGATFQGWARPGPYEALFLNRSTGSILTAARVTVAGHRDDLVIDVPAAEWQRWRDEKPPATCPP